MDIPSPGEPAPGGPSRRPPFGSALREWRQGHGLSQMELGLHAGVSARHLSFLETGRARPSQEMVLRLAAALDLPLRERNDLLLGAGYAPRYPARSLDDAGLAEARRALQFILDMHEPFPAFVLDRSWGIVMWNRTQGLMLRDLHGPSGSPADLNALDMVFAPGPVRESFLNWGEVAGAVLRRLRRQVARVGSADPLRRTWERIRAMPGVAGLSLEEDAGRPPPILVPMLMREGDVVLRWFSTLATFGAAGDVTLDELVIESFFPGDETTRAFVEEVARQAGARLRRDPGSPPGPARSGGGKGARKGTGKGDGARRGSRGAARAAVARARKAGARIAEGARAARGRR